MKPSILLLVVFAIALVGPNFAQSSIDDQIQVLQRQVPGRLEARDYDGAVEIGEKIAVLEKSKGRSGNLLYIAALRNVATWQRLAFTKLRVEPSNPRPPWKEISRRAERATDNFREVFKLLLPMNEPEMLAAASLDLGSMLVRLSITSERCLEAEPLFKSVIEHETGKDRAGSASWLAALQYSIDCRLYAGDLETAMAELELLIPRAESHWKPNDKRFAPIYGVYASLLLMIGKADEAENIAQKIRSITENSAFVADYTRLLPRRSIGKLELTVGTPPSILMGQSSVSVPNPSAVPGGNPLGYQTPGYNPSNPRATQDTTIESAHSGRQIIPPSTRLGTGVGGGIISGQRGQMILVQVTIDETGYVVDTIARHPSPDVQENISKLAKKWRFRPLVLNGQPRKMTGLINVSYFKKITSEPKADPK